MQIVAADDRTRRLLRRARLGTAARAGRPEGSLADRCWPAPRADRSRRAARTEGVGTLTVRAATRAQGPTASVRRMSESTDATRPERDRPWVMRTYAGHSSAAASNALYRRNLDKGQTGLSVAFDLPTQTGYDPDHDLARGEVGKVGVPISHIGDMRPCSTTSRCRG